MSDNHQQYLTDEKTVDTIYTYLKSDDLSSATAFLMSLGDDKLIMKTWIGVQCDINNVLNDPHTSEKIARAGVEFALGRGFKTSAAILLHNISAFHMPAFDEKVDPAVIPGIIEASSKQVELRLQLEDKNSLAWAHWDHGMSLLAGVQTAEAVQAFEKSIAIANEIGDRDLEAWSQIFIGKAKIKSGSGSRSEGEAIMRQAAATITEIGEDWEKEEVAKILATAGLT